MIGKSETGIHEHTTPGEALQLAMKREKAANNFYLNAAAIVVDPGVKKLFEFLAHEETRHYELIEKEYDRFIAKEN